MKEHNDRDTDRSDDLSQKAQRVAEVGRETASKAATYVRDSRVTHPEASEPCCPRASVASRLHHHRALAR